MGTVYTVPAILSNIVTWGSKRISSMTTTENTFYNLVFNQTPAVILEGTQYGTVDGVQYTYYNTAHLAGIQGTVTKYTLYHDTSTGEYGLLINGNSLDSVRVTNSYSIPANYDEHSTHSEFLQTGNAARYYANSAADIDYYPDFDSANRALYGANIVYRLTNCTAPNAPTEAISGSTVTVPISFPTGYGVNNPSTDAYVTNNGIVVPSTYSNGILTFTMP